MNVTVILFFILQEPKRKHDPHVIDLTVSSDEEDEYNTAKKPSTSSRYKLIVGSVIFNDDVKHLLRALEDQEVVVLYMVLRVWRGYHNCCTGTHVNTLDICKISF